MTSRERVLAAAACRWTDRIPRDFWAEPAALNRLLAFLGHSDEERLLRDLGVDIRRIQAREPEPVLEAGGVWRNMWGERYVLRDTEWGPVREDLPGALADAVCESELEQFPWPTPDQFDYSPIAEQCSRHQDYALLYGFADVWQRPALVGGWEHFFLDMVERPVWAHRLCRIFTDFYKEDYRRAQAAANGRLDLFLLISDLGTQRGPLVSLPMFRTFVAPYLREMIEHIHALGARVLFHSCGDVHRFIPDLIALNVDILDPIQPVCDAMSPESLSARYRGLLCFHGGLDMQRLLPAGSPDEIRAEVRRYSKTLGESGGYILAPAHLFQPDVPPQNILAMYESG